MRDPDCVKCQTQNRGWACREHHKKMSVYAPGTDHFDPEYLAYLDTLTSEVIAGATVRLTHNNGGRLVRIEMWSPGEGNIYRNITLEGWMNE